MLTSREVATMRAALLYWRQEISPHGDEAASPYLEPPDVRPLDIEEIDRLRVQLHSQVRYVSFDPATNSLASLELLPVVGEPAAPSSSVATVILPARSSTT